MTNTTLILADRMAAIEALALSSGSHEASV